MAALDKHNLPETVAQKREREARFYHERPEQLMPVMVPVRQMKGRVQWPGKFQ